MHTHTHTRLRLSTIIMTKFQLVIFSLADYLLAGWSEKDDVFVLCCVAALDVTERGYGSTIPESQSAIRYLSDPICLNSKIIQF